MNAVNRTVRSPAILLTGILLLALALRLLGIFSRPLWYDEAFSILFAGKGPSAMWLGTFGSGTGGAAEEHPLLYYMALWGWMGALGNSPAAARLLSIVPGLVTVGLSFLLGRQLFGDRTGLLAAALVAGAPFQVHYSQEVRMYSLMACFTTAATVAFWKAEETGAWISWAAVALFAACAQYSHSLAAFYILALGLIPFLERRWRDATAMAVAGIVALLLYLPWLVHLPAQLTKIEGPYWIGVPEWYRLITVLASFVVNLPLPGTALIAGVAVTAMVIALGITQTTAAWRAHNPEARNGLRLLYLAIVPPLLMFLFSQWRPVFVERGLLPSGVIFCVWLGWALFATPAPPIIRAIATGALALGAVVGIFIHVTYAGFPYAPFPELDRYLSANIRAGDVILHSSKLSALPAFYYSPRLPQTFIADPPGGETDTLAAVTQQVLGLTSVPSLPAAVDGRDRVWFVIYQKSMDEYRSAGYSTQPELAWLDQHMHQVQRQDWGSLSLYEYQP